MKRCKTLLVIIAMCLLGTVISCTGGNANHEHSYTDWIISKDPTFEAEGEAYKYCNCLDREEILIPSLSDETVWSVKKHVDSTCAVQGSDTYTSIYGDVVVMLELAEHEYANWVITTKPTFEATGVAARTCKYGDVEEVVIPNVLDETVWTLDEHVDSTCTENGHSTYSSVYGVVTISLELAPHTYGAWIMDVEPTLTSEGEAHHVCECSYSVSTVVPALSDPAWSVASEVLPSYNEGGSKTYASVYGEVTISVAKKVAPYDGKTYSAFAFDAADANDGFRRDVISCETAWNKATVTLDANGTGLGTGFPFRGIVSIKMINEETGEIEITIQGIEYDENNVPVVDEEGNVIIVPENVSVSRGYVDFETGIIVKPFNNSYNDVLVYTPFEVAVTGETAKASAWNNTIAIDYTFNEVTHSMMVFNNKVYFGISFVDFNGASVAAVDAYKSAYVYANNASGKIAGFVHNGTELVIADGHEGSFNGELGEVFVSGYGVVTVNGVSGTYVEAEDKLGVYVDGSYYEMAFAEGAYTAVKPMVAINYVPGEYASVENESVNKNIAYELPVLESETMFFDGWYYDEACTEAVGAEFVPTVDVTLYAKWSVKLFINLVGVLEGDANVIVLGEGDVIGSKLPAYGLEIAQGVMFKGWYLDEKFENALPEAAEVTLEDNNISIYAKWEEIPAYYGTYKGTEIWNAGYGNSSIKNITIDENGNISGQYSGVVNSYDPEQQLIVWTQTGKSSTSNMWYDDETGVLIIDYGRRDYISNDIYIYSKYEDDGKLAANYAVKCNLNPSSTSVGWYAHFVNIMGKNGATEIFIYDSRIYSNFTAKSITGEVLTAATVRNSKDVVVRDGETNEMILAVSSLGSSFNSNTNTVTLDAYFGTYTNGTEEVVLDGTGNITYAGNTGTYAVSENEAYGFDVYLNEGTEYYQLTLNGESFTIVYPVVEITFEVGTDHTPIASQSYNINVPATLPNGDDEGYVFNGWFLDAEFTNPVPETFKPTAAITVYAKYSMPAVLTVVYNNGEENGEFIYSVGDIATMELPVYAKHAFVGWYTTAEFAEGSEWTNGEAINESVTIYAKWEQAPVYNNTYVPTEVEGKSETGTSSIYTWTGAKVEISPYGSGTCSAYPFRGDVSITDYDAEAGTLLFNVGSNVYRGWIDAATGLIVINSEYGATTPIKNVFVVSPFETRSLASVIKSSYWNSGTTFCITYPYDGTDYTMFVNNDNVYFNVAFKDAEGNAVAAEACYTSPVLFVVDAEGNLIGKYGYDGTTMQELDGYEGTYANGDETLVLDGVKNVVLNGVAGTYAKAAEGVAYTFDVYADGSYYEVTVDKASMTYSINKPFVTITFETNGYATVEAVTVNKNIAIELVSPENANYIFRAWYADAEFNQIVDTNYVPTETCTLYAKWDEKVTLTVVYGNGLEDVVLNYGVGDTTKPKEPAFTNGKVFDGWFLDTELTQPYTPGVIEGNTTIYVKWIESSPFYGEWAGANIYGSSTNGGVGSGGSSRNITIDSNGKMTGTRSGQITDYDAETGMFKLNGGYGHYDAENGVLICNFSGSSTTLGNDMYVFVKGATSAAASSASSYWNKGLTRIIEFTLSGHEQSTMYVFIHNGIVYGNVTFSSTGGDVTAKTAYQASDLSVYDCNGELIATFVKSGSTLVNA